VAKLAVLQNNLASLKTKKIESGGKSAALQARIEAVTKEKDVIEAITMRQQTIKTLWHYSSPLYKSMTAELNEKQQQLTILLATVR